MCHCSLILMKKQNLSDGNLQHTNPVLKLLIPGSLHYTHSDKTSKIVAANMFWGTSPPLYLLSLKPAFQHPLLKKLARKSCLSPTALLLDTADWSRTGHLV